MYCKLNIDSKITSTSHALGLQTSRTCSHSSWGRWRQGHWKVLCIAQRYCPPHHVPWRSIAGAQELTPRLWIETIFPFQHTALPHFCFGMKREWNGVKEAFGKWNKNGVLFLFSFPCFLSITSPQDLKSQDILADTIQSWPLQALNEVTASRRKVHWKGHRRGFVLPKKDGKFQEGSGCWLQW